MIPILILKFLSCQSPEIEAPEKKAAVIQTKRLHCIILETNLEKNMADRLNEEIYQVIDRQYPGLFYFSESRQCINHDKPISIQIKKVNRYKVSVTSNAGFREQYAIHASEIPMVVSSMLKAEATADQSDN